MPTIKLLSSDGETFDVDVQIARFSSTIKTMLDDLRVEDGEEHVIPLPNVKSAILSKVIAWLAHHKDDLLPTEDDDDENNGDRTNDIDSWHEDFLKVDHDTLFGLIKAAHFLDIKGLLNITTQAVANTLKDSLRGKSLEEIRKNLNVKSDFTPEEEEQVLKENEWLMQE